MWEGWRAHPLPAIRSPSSLGCATVPWYIERSPTIESTPQRFFEPFCMLSSSSATCALEGGSSRLRVWVSASLVGCGG